MWHTMHGMRPLVARMRAWPGTLRPSAAQSEASEPHMATVNDQRINATPSLTGFQTGSGHSFSKHPENTKAPRIPYLFAMT